MVGSLAYYSICNVGQSTLKICIYIVFAFSCIFPSTQPYEGNKMQLGNFCGVSFLWLLNDIIYILRVSTNPAIPSLYSVCYVLLF